MNHDKMFRLCVKLLRGATVTGKGSAVAYKRVWRQVSRGIDCTKFVDSFEAARAFIKLERPGYTCQEPSCVEQDAGA